MTTLKVIANAPMVLGGAPLYHNETLLSTQHRTLALSDIVDEARYAARESAVLFKTEQLEPQGSFCVTIKIDDETLAKCVEVLEDDYERAIFKAATFAAYEAVSHFDQES